MENFSTLVQLDCNVPAYTPPFENITQECLTAQLSNSSGKVSVLCNQTDSFQHAGFLTNNNQIVTCIKSAMQVVGLFTDEQPSYIVNITSLPLSSCPNTPNPPTYLTSLLARKNVTFTLGISPQVTTCLPSSGNPFEAFAHQNVQLDLTQGECQSYTLLNKSNPTGGSFSLQCGQSLLDEKSALGEQILCDPQKAPHVNIRYSPNSQFALNSSLTIQKKTISCTHQDIDHDGGFPLALKIFFGVLGGAFILRLCIPPKISSSGYTKL